MDRFRSYCASNRENLPNFSFGRDPAAVTPPGIGFNITYFCCINFIVTLVCTRPNNENYF
jgi:hypothetical protein